MFRLALHFLEKSAQKALFFKKVPKNLFGSAFFISVLFGFAFYISVLFGFAFCISVLFGHLAGVRPRAAEQLAKANCYVLF